MLDELREFAKKAYSYGGLDRIHLPLRGDAGRRESIGKLPADNPRILIVFTDGEDLNSAVKREESTRRPRRPASSMPMSSTTCRTPTPNKYLAKFANAHHGKIWKAKSEVDLVSIWESVATAMDYSYILTYVFSLRNLSSWCFQKQRCLILTRLN